MAGLDDFEYLQDLPEDQRKRVVLGKDEDGYPVPMLDGKQVLPPAVPLEEIVTNGGKGKTKTDDVQVMGPDGGGGSENAKGDKKPQPTIVTPGFHEIDTSKPIAPTTSPTPTAPVDPAVFDTTKPSDAFGAAKVYADTIDAEDKDKQFREGYVDNVDRDQGVMPVEPDKAKLIGTGITKSFVSGIPQLYGLGGAITDYAMSRAQGGDTSFGEQFFAPGGMDAVKQEADDFVQDYAQDNPDAKLEEVQHAYDDHRATPEYYNFLADQMRPGISAGMKNAMTVNSMAGIKETPDGQAAIDKLAEDLSGVLIPTGKASIITKMASTITSKVGRVAAKAAIGAGKMALPGSSGVGSATAGAALTIGMHGYANARGKPQYRDPRPDEIGLSPGMTDPRNGQPVTSYSTMAEPVENAHLDPDTPPLIEQPKQLFKPMPTDGQQPVPIGGTPTIQPPMPSNTKIAMPQTINQGVTPGPAGVIGGTLAVIGGTAALIKGGKYLGSVVQRARGALPVNVDVHAGQLSPHGVAIAPAIARRDKINASTAIRGNLIPDTNGTLPQRVAKAFSNAINKDTYAEAEAREVGGNALERIVQSELGTKLSRDAKAADIARIMEHGVMPNGNVMRTNPKDFITRSAAMTQEQRTNFVRLMQDLNIVQRRDEAWQNLLNRQRTLQQQVAQGVPTASAELNEVNNAINMHRAGRPNSRLTFTQAQTGTLRRNISTARRDPEVRELERMFRDISRDLVDYEHHTSVISAQAAITYAANSHHMPLFEFEHAKLIENRTPHADPTNQAMTDASPQRAIDPWSAVMFKVYASTNRGNNNAATTRIINAFRAADTQERHVREVNEAGHGTVTILENGNERHFQFARPDVANAIKAQPLDVPSLLKWANIPRTVAQRFITGPLAGTLYTPLRSVVFDAFATQATMQQGRVFGLAGGAIARVSPQNMELARRISAVDPTVAISTMRGGAQAALAHAYRSTGDKVAKMAVQQSPLWRAVGNIPGGQQYLQDLGQRMAHAYDSSAIAVLERSNGVQMHQMVQDTLLVRNEVERYMRTVQNAGRSGNAVIRATVDPTWNAIRSTYQAYAGAINIIHNASRYGYWLQNYAILERNAARQGRAVTEQEVRTLAEEVRRSAGDLGGQPGNRLAQSTAALFLYENISMQTARHVVKATMRDPMQTGLAVSALAASAYASYRSVIDRGPEAENWYWNRANPWERIGTMRHIPKPETIAYMATHGGKPKPWNPDDPHGDYYDIQMSPEFMPLVTLYMAGLEHAGLVKRPNEATTNLGDLGFSLADALAFGRSPAINSVLIPLTGQSLNMTAGFAGRAPMQGPQTSYGVGIGANKTAGGLPFSVPMLMTETFGLAGTAGFNMIDQGMNAYHQGHSVGDSAKRAVVELEDFLKERPAVPDIPGLYNAPAKVYRTTPAMRLAQQRHMTVVGVPGRPSPIAQQWSFEFGDKSKRPMAMTVPRVQDMEVLQMMYEVHNAYARKGDIKDAWTDLGDSRKDAAAVDRAKPSFSLSQIQSGEYREKQRKSRYEMQSNADTLMQATEDFQKKFAVTYADRFKKEGLPATLEGLEALVKRVARPLAPGELPMSRMVGSHSHH